MYQRSRPTMMPLNAHAQCVEQARGDSPRMRLAKHHCRSTSFVCTSLMLTVIEHHVLNNSKQFYLFISNRINTRYTAQEKKALKTYYIYDGVSTTLHQQSKVGHIVLLLDRPSNMPPKYWHFGRVALLRIVEWFQHTLHD